MAKYDISEINEPDGSALKPEFEQIIKAANK